MDHVVGMNEVEASPESLPQPRVVGRVKVLYGAAVAVCVLVVCSVLWYALRSTSRASEPSPRRGPGGSAVSVADTSSAEPASAVDAGPPGLPGTAGGLLPEEESLPEEDNVLVEETVETEEQDISGLEAIRRAIAEAKSASPYRLTGGGGDGGERRDVVEIGIAYGTEKRHWLQWAVEEFAATDEGRKILVNLIPMGSMEAAQAVLDGDERIHVWAPASTMYLSTFLRDWEAKRRGNPILKGENLALTPMVIVMWKSRYDSFLIKAPGVSMEMIGHAMRTKTGWGAIAGRPEWGHFKFGHTHPNQSNSGLMTLVLLAYGFHRKTSGLAVSDIMSQEFQDYLAWFERGVTGLSNSTGNMMREMVHRGPASFDGLIVYESVAIDYFRKAEGRWGPLYVVYPDYNVWNDNPYYILDTAWTTEAHQQAAETFLGFLMSEAAQERALDHGFRPGNPAVSVKGPASPFVRYARFGLRIELPAVCEPPSPEVIDNLQQSWIRNAVPH